MNLLTVTTIFFLVEWVIKISLLIYLKLILEQEIISLKTTLKKVFSF
jgi:hypothetical protein